MKITAKKQSKLNMTMKFFGKRGFRSNYSKVKPRIRIVLKVKSKVSHSSGGSDLVNRGMQRSSLAMSQGAAGMGLLGIGFASLASGIQQGMAGQAASRAAQLQAFGQQQAIDAQRMFFENRMASRGHLRSGQE